MQTRKMMVFVMLVLALVLGTAVVHAITIIVDGDRESVWLTGSGSQTPGGISDPNETAILEDNVDISMLRWTNDTTHMYFAVETHASPPRLSNFPTPTNLYICLDTDNNSSTGSTYANCNAVNGFDRYIYVPGTGTPQVYNASFSLLGTGTLGYNPLASTPIIEIGVPMSLLGFGSGVCPSTINAVIYYDNGTGDPDDNLPDAGSVVINCGSPTAVSLQSFTSASNNLPVIGLVGMLALVIVSFGLLIVRRERRA